MSQLRVFLDANEWIRLALSFHETMAPTRLRLDRLELTGDPVAIIVLVAEAGELVNGQTIAICSSIRTLALTRAKLAAGYEWEPAIVDEFTRFIARVIRVSGGAVQRGDVSPRVYGTLTDREDLHRLADAHECHAELFVTEDREILDAWSTDATLRPVSISARDFVERMRRGRRT